MKTMNSERMIEMVGEDSIDYILEGLDEAADPAIVYVVLIAVKNDLDRQEVIDHINKIQPLAKDYFRRFPAVLNRLPESLREEVIKYGDTR